MTPSPLPAPRWLSFDCYGTLVDWEGGVRRSFREVAHIRPEEEEELFRCWERMQWGKIQGPYAPYARILQDTFREALEQFGYHCATHSTETFLNSVARWEPFPDVNSALTRLAQRHRLAIVSNVDRELLGWTLRHFPVRFDALITAEDARLYKPNPEIFRYALGKLSCAPNEIVHVAFGAEYDLLPASSVGIRVVYLDRGKPLSASNLPLEAEIANLNELDGMWGAR